MAGLAYSPTPTARISFARAGRVLATGRVTLFFALGFCTGVPLMWGWSNVFVWFGQLGIEAELGSALLRDDAKLVSLPVFAVLACLLAPLADRFAPPIFARRGRRRGWLTFWLAVAIVLSVAVAAFGPGGVDGAGVPDRRGWALRIVFAVATAGVFICVVALALERAGRYWAGLLCGALVLGALLGQQFLARFAVYREGTAVHAHAWIGWVFVAGLCLAALLVWRAVEPRVGAGATPEPAFPLAVIAEPWRAFGRDLGGALWPSLLGFLALMMAFGGTAAIGWSLRTNLLEGLPGERIGELADLQGRYYYWSDSFNVVAQAVGVVLGIVATLRWPALAAARLLGAICLAYLAWFLILLAARLVEPVWLWTFVSALSHLLWGFELPIFFALLALWSRPPNTGGQAAALALIASLPFFSTDGIAVALRWAGGWPVAAVFAALAIAAILLLRLADKRMRRS